MNESKVVINLNENNINIGPFLNNENEEYETSYYKYTQLGPEPIGYSNNDNYYDIDSNDSKEKSDSPIVLKKIVNKKFTVQSSVCKNVYNNMTSVDPNKITNIHCFWCCHSFSNKPCFLPIEFTNDITNRESRKIPNTKLVVSVSLLNIERTDLAFDYDGLTPNYTSMNDLHIENAYFQHIKYIVNQLNPNYLIIAIEVNELLKNTPSKWDEYK